MKELTSEETREILFGITDVPEEWHETTLATINVWLERGDGIAIYQNHDLGHPTLGDYQFASFGSQAAQLEVDEPPTTMPDIGHQINWRYQLVGTYRGEPL